MIYRMIALISAPFLVACNNEKQNFPDKSTIETAVQQPLITPFVRNAINDLQKFCDTKLPQRITLNTILDGLYIESADPGHCGLMSVCRQALRIGRVKFVEIEIDEVSERPGTRAIELTPSKGLYQYKISDLDDPTCEYFLDAEFRITKQDRRKSPPKKNTLFYGDVPDNKCISIRKINIPESQFILKPIFKRSTNYELSLDDPRIELAEPIQINEHYQIIERESGDIIAQNIDFRVQKIDRAEARRQTDLAKKSISSYSTSHSISCSDGYPSERNILNPLALTEGDGHEN